MIKRLKSIGMTALGVGLILACGTSPLYSSCCPAPNGPPGLRGQRGHKGPMGPDGLQGIPGTQGIQGTQGPRGNAGPDGDGEVFSSCGTDSFPYLLFGTLTLSDGFGGGPGYFWSGDSSSLFLSFNDFGDYVVNAIVRGPSGGITATTIHREFGGVTLIFDPAGSATQVDFVAARCIDLTASLDTLSLVNQSKQEALQQGIDLPDTPAEPVTPAGVDEAAAPTEPATEQVATI